MTGKIITFGEIMLRLSTPGFERFSQAKSFNAMYGGGEANVAASLARFGHEVEFVTRLPANDLGEACLSHLCAFGIGTQHIVCGGERIGIYFLENGVAQRPSKVVYDRAYSSFSTLEKGMIDWEAAFKDASWFHWTGITPAVSQGAAEVCLEGVQVARSKGMNISCDLNYRSKLWKWTNSPRNVMEELVSLCDLAIGNEEDAEKVFGIQAPGSDVAHGNVDPLGYHEVCEQLTNMFPHLSSVAITLRGSLSASHNTWSGILYHDGKMQVGPIYDIQPIVDRVGGGDSFAAGLIHGLNQENADPKFALSFALAASCLKHSIPGDFNAVNLSEVDQLMKGNYSGRISR